MSIFDTVKHLDFPLGKYVVVGGGALAARGMRQTRDIDIVVLPDLFQHLIQAGWPFDDEYERKWKRKRLKQGDIEIYPDMYLARADQFLNVEELITEADIIEGLPFHSLQSLMMCKLDAGSEKDLQDIKLIKQLQKTIDASLR